MMIIYFIIIGDILCSFPREFLKESGTIITTRPLYVVIVGAILSPFIFKKQIHELKGASILLFVAIFMFIIVFTFQLISAGADQNGDEDFSEYYKFTFDRQFFTSIAVFMTAYSFQFNLFPVMNSMKAKSNVEGIKSVYYALLMAMGIYITLSVLSIYTFGSSLQADVLDNVNEEVEHEWESMVLRIAFVIVIVCHIPYIFFSAKEAMLIIIDEWDR
jgi:amino acid permease